MLGIYARISREKEEGKDRSINDQIESGKELAKKLDLNYEVYMDEGFSGTLEIEDRPELMRLIEDVLNKKITHVFAYDQSRLERNKDVWSKLYVIFQDKDTKLFFRDSGEFNFKSHENYLYSHITSLINNFYAKLASRKIKSVLARNVEAGKVHAIPAFGYAKNEEGLLIIDEEEALIVKQIFDLSLKGIGTDSIANSLNSSNIPTRYNKINVGTYSVKNKHTGVIKQLEKSKTKWRGGTIRSIITNTIYKGIRVWKGVNYKAPIIIAPEYWDEVNTNLPKNANNTGKKVNHQYLLKGLIICAKCGRNMYGKSRENKKDHYYQCSSKRYKGESCGNRSINIDKIEGIIWTRFFKGNDLLELLKKDVVKDDSKIETLKSDALKHHKVLESLRKEKSELIIAVSKGLLTDEEIISQKNVINTRVIEVEILIKDIENQIYNSKNSKRLIDDYNSEFENITDELTFLEKKEIINKYIKEILVLSWDNQPNLYSLIIFFRINLEIEHYIFYRPTDTLVSLNDRLIINSKYFNPKSEKIISVENKLLAKIWVLPETKEIIAPPYEIAKEKMSFFSNNIIPYYTLPVNKTSWTRESIINFYEKNPKFLCKESGISIISKDENQEYYEELKRDYQKFKDNPLSDWIDFILNQPKSS